MLEQLKEQVYQANMGLQHHGLVTFTWGNVSGIDREQQLIVIKPSGVAYEQLTPENMVVVDFDGHIVEGALKPSSDTATHIELYKAFVKMNGIVHTHSPFATAWAQAGCAIPALGTTHADYFYGDIPCSRPLTDEEIAEAYERNTGKVIIETIRKNIADGAYYVCSHNNSHNAETNNDIFYGDEMSVPGIIVNEHAPFAWGTSPDNALHNAVVLEEVAKMAINSLQINPKLIRINQALLDKHYLRKHGKNAYYGQK